MTEHECKEVPLIELLESVPRDAQLAVECTDYIGTTYYPVGHLCHEAARVLRDQLKEKNI
jgi:hypothetical protein